MKDDEFEGVIAKFRRESLGPMVAHMADAQIASFLEPFRALTEVDEEPPVWWVKRRDAARVELLRALLNRGALSD